MKKRLLADTCSAIKLATFGDRCFQKGKLSRGDIVVHPLVQRQIKGFHPDKKKRLSQELAALKSIRAEPNLTQSGDVFSGIQETIRLMEDQLNIPIGRDDRQLIATALFYDDMAIITNDYKTLTPVAVSLEVTLLTAEDIVVEAVNDGLISIEEAMDGISHWNEIGEMPNKVGVKLLKDHHLFPRET